MSKSKAIILILILCTLVSLVGCAQTQKNYVSTKTSLELQAIQKREFETTYKTAFAATLSIFQDKGFIINTADATTGLVTAASNKDSKFIPFVGQAIEYTKSTAFIELVSSGKVAIRLNFVKHQETSNGYGMAGGNSVPIEDPVFYQKIFEDIQKGIFVRSNLN